jgi:hypothetical protein
MDAATIKLMCHLSLSLIVAVLLLATAFTGRAQQGGDGAFEPLKKAIAEAAAKLMAHQNPMTQTDAPLELVSWNYRLVKGDGSSSDRHVFDYELKNRTDRAIKLVHGRIEFRDLLGGKLFEFDLRPDYPYPAHTKMMTSMGISTISIWLALQPGIERMPTLAHEDVKASVFIEGVVFEDGSIWKAETK